MMTNTKHAPHICTSSDKTVWTKHPLKTEAGLYNLDRQKGRQYLPMDVYVDPRTIKEHFQASS